MTITSKLKLFFTNLDIYQVLSIPLIILLILISIDRRPDDVKLGILLDSNQALRIRSQENAVLLAANHINEAGGIKGKKLTLVINKTNSTTNEALYAVRDMIYKNGVSAIIGGMNPATTRAIQDLAEQTQTPLITPFCTHYEITANGHSFTFRSITDDLQQFEALCGFAVHRFNSRRPAIIYDQELYGANSVEKLVEIAGKAGQQISNAVSYNAGSVNFKNQLNVIKASNPDSLFILTNPDDAAMIVRQFRESGFKHPVLGGNQLASPRFIKFAGIHAESSICTLPFNPRMGGQRAEFFISEFAGKYSMSTDADSALAYEAMMLMALAFKSGNSNPIAVRNALSQMHGWESITGSGGFDSNNNQVRPAEIAIIRERQPIPMSMEELF